MKESDLRISFDWFEIVYDSNAEASQRVENSENGDWPWQFTKHGLSDKMIKLLMAGEGETLAIKKQGEGRG